MFPKYSWFRMLKWLQIIKSVHYPTGRLQEELQKEQLKECDTIIRTELKKYAIRAVTGQRDQKSHGKSARTANWQCSIYLPDRHFPRHSVPLSQAGYW